MSSNKLKRNNLTRFREFSKCLYLKKVTTGCALIVKIFLAELFFKIDKKLFLLMPSYKEYAHNQVCYASPSSIDNTNISFRNRTHSCSGFWQIFQTVGRIRNCQRTN
jgi:hypothetical protein